MRKHLLMLIVAAFLSSSLCVAQQSNSAESTKRSGQKVDLNTATEKDLAALPGVNQQDAKKILAHRPYASADDLKAAGITASEIERLRPLVVASSTPGIKQPVPPATKSKGQLRPEEQPQDPGKQSPQRSE